MLVLLCWYRFSVNKDLYYWKRERERVALARRDAANANSVMQQPNPKPNQLSPSPTQTLTLSRGRRIGVNLAKYWEGRNQSIWGITRRTSRVGWASEGIGSVSDGQTVSTLYM